MLLLTLLQLLLLLWLLLLLLLWLLLEKVAFKRCGHAVEERCCGYCMGVCHIRGLEQLGGMRNILLLKLQLQLQWQHLILLLHCLVLLLLLRLTVLP